MSFSISLDVGQYGGFYFRHDHRTRLCLGWVAITFYPEEIDEILGSLADKIDPGWRD